MNNFPTISRRPARAKFIDEQDPKSVLQGRVASGYPLLNKLFTFDPRTFSFDLRSVFEADKLTVMAFYEANKDVPFYWLNAQDGTQYEVAFASRPRCRIDGRVDLWRISLELRQTANVSYQLLVASSTVASTVVGALTVTP